MLVIMEMKDISRVVGVSIDPFQGRMCHGEAERARFLAGDRIRLNDIPPRHNRNKRRKNQ